MSSRDPYDDDRRDEGYDDHTDPPRDVDDRRDRRREAALQRVKLPGLFLVITGLCSLFIAVMYITLLWLAPDQIVRGQYDAMKQLLPNQPMPPYEEFVKQQQIQASIFNGIRIITSILVVLGGMKMRSLEGYGLAMTASVVAIIPLCTSECCCALPFGIWSLIVLLNADVKRSF